MRFTPKIAVAAITAAAIIAAGGLASATVGTSTPSNFNPVTSVRVLDTRTTHTPVAAGATYVADLTKAIPVNATAVVLNLTVTDVTGGGYVLAYPDGATRPNPGSTLNFGKSQTIANAVTVAVTNDKIDIYNGSSGSVDLIGDLEGYYTAAPAAYTPPQTSWTATSTVSDHPDSGDTGTWAVDTLTRTASITLKGAASVYHCGSGATSCYLYEGSIADTGSFTTASSGGITTDGLSPNAGRTINGTVEGTVTGGSAIQFYASSNAPLASSVPATVTGPVSGEKTTTNWVEQFFTAGTTFGSGPALLNWTWTYSAPNTCEQWMDAYNGQTGDIAGVNACVG